MKPVLHNRSQGFTLVEMIMVIVITGILAAIVALFIRRPVEGYVDSARRAAMTDAANLALRRIGRDLHTAVPNSIRLPTPAGSSYLEFLPTKDGGRYRGTPAGSSSSGCTGSPKGPALSFSTADTCFEIIGPAIDLTRGATDDVSDQIVIGSTQANGDPPYDSTVTGVRRPYTGATGSQTIVNITAVKYPAFAQLPDQRFDVVPATQQAVTYFCDGPGTDANGNGTGVLRRYWAYGYNLALTAPASLGGNNAILVDNVSACNIVYDTSNQREGLVEITMALTREHETVSLYHEIHINNVP